MHTPSTRILSALAYDLGREYDPTDPVCQALADAVMQSEHAMRIADDDGTYEKARQRQRRRERDRERAAIPDWFSALGTPDDGVRRMGIDEAGPHIAVDSERAAEPLPRGRSAGTARLAAVAYQLEMVLEVLEEGEDAWGWSGDRSRGPDVHLAPDRTGTATAVMPSRTVPPISSPLPIQRRLPPCQLLTARTGHRWSKLSG